MFHPFHEVGSTTALYFMLIVNVMFVPSQFGHLMFISTLIFYHLWLKAVTEVTRNLTRIAVVTT